MEWDSWIISDRGLVSDGSLGEKFYHGPHLALWGIGSCLLWDQNGDRIDCITLPLLVMAGQRRKERHDSATAPEIRAEQQNNST
jgi:hypothetical protein